MAYGTERLPLLPPVQCAISTGTVVSRSTVPVAPPSTISRRREWPKQPMTISSTPMS